MSLSADCSTAVGAAKETPLHLPLPLPFPPLPPPPPLCRILRSCRLLSPPSPPPSCLQRFPSLRPPRQLRPLQLPSAEADSDTRSCSQILSPRPPPSAASSLPPLTSAVGSVSSAQPSPSPSPSPPSNAAPAPSHRPSTSLTLPFSLLPPAPLTFSSSAFSSYLAGEEDPPLPPELDHLWLCYEEESSNIVAITALDTFARALLPSLPHPVSSPPLPCRGQPCPPPAAAEDRRG